MKTGRNFAQLLGETDGRNVSSSVPLPCPALPCLALGPAPALATPSKYAFLITTAYTLPCPALPCPTSPGLLPACPLDFLLLPPPTLHHTPLRR